MTTNYTVEEYVTMYDWYDGPLSYTFRYKGGGQLYYGRLITVEEDDILVHWIVPVTEELLLDAEKGNISVRTLMTSNEKIGIERDFGAPTLMTLSEAMNRYKDDLPKHDVKLIN